MLLAIILPLLPIIMNAPCYSLTPTTIIMKFTHPTDIMNAPILFIHPTQMIMNAPMLLTHAIRYNEGSHAILCKHVCRMQQYLS